MIDEALRIYVDRLRTQGAEQVNETVSPAFLKVNEKELCFEDPVSLKGEASLVQDELVLMLEVTTKVRMPCAICNKLVPIDIEIKDLVFATPIHGLKRGVFDMSEMLREEILLQVPYVAECNEGKCPGRKEMERYLKKKSGEFRPFADLDKEEM